VAVPEDGARIEPAALLALSRKAGRESAAYRVGCRHGSALLPPPSLPPEIIQHAIWLYLRFTLSYRDAEELLAERGLDISYETVRAPARRLLDRMISLPSKQPSS
jgi:hypothetical protein